MSVFLKPKNPLKQLFRNLGEGSAVPKIPKMPIGIRNLGDEPALISVERAIFNAFTISAKKQTEGENRARAFFNAPSFFRKSTTEGEDGVGDRPPPRVRARTKINLKHGEDGNAA